MVYSLWQRCNLTKNTSELQGSCPWIEIIGNWVVRELSLWMSHSLPLSMQFWHAHFGASLDYHCVKINSEIWHVWWPFSPALYRHCKPHPMINWHHKLWSSDTDRTLLVHWYRAYTWLLVCTIGIKLTLYISHNIKHWVIHTRTLTYDTLHFAVYLLA